MDKGMRGGCMDQHYRFVACCAASYRAKQWAHVYCRLSAGGPAGRAVPPRKCCKRALRFTSAASSSKRSLENDGPLLPPDAIPLDWPPLVTPFGASFAVESWSRWDEGAKEARRSGGATNNSPCCFPPAVNPCAFHKSPS